MMKGNKAAAAADEIRTAARAEAIAFVDRICDAPEWGFRETLVEALTVKLTVKATEAAGLKDALEPFAHAGAGIPKTVADVLPIAYVTNDARCAGTMTTLTAKEFRKAAKAFPKAQRK